MKMIVFMIWDLLFSNLRFIPRESTQPVVPEQHQEAGLQEMEHIFLFHVYIYIYISCYIFFVFAMVFWPYLMLTFHFVEDLLS